MRSSGRRAARATLGEGFPARTLSIVRRVHNVAIAHVSAQPPSHPGRSGFPSPVGGSSYFPKEPSHRIRGLSTRLHTPLDAMVISSVRHPGRLHRVPAQCPAVGPPRMPATHREPLCPREGVTASRNGVVAPFLSALPDVHRSYWLMRQTKLLLPTSVSPISIGLCRLLRVPAGGWPFPTLSLRSLHRRLGPYPATPERCGCPLLPARHRPPLRVKRIGA